LVDDDPLDSCEEECARCLDRCWSRSDARALFDNEEDDVGASHCRSFFTDSSSSFILCFPSCSTSLSDSVLVLESPQSSFFCFNSVMPSFSSSEACTSQIAPQPPPLPESVLADKLIITPSSSSSFMFMLMEVIDGAASMSASSIDIITASSTAAAVAIASASAFSAAEASASIAEVTLTFAFSCVPSSGSSNKERDSRFIIILSLTIQSEQIDMSSFKYGKLLLQWIV